MRSFKKMMAVLLCGALMAMTAAMPAAAARMPQASGSTTFSQGGMTVDASNVSDGYVMVKYDGSSPRVKLQITKNTTYTFDVTTRGTYEVFPLTEGNGSYKIQGFEHVSGNQYAPVFNQTVSVSLSDEFGPLL